MAKSQGSVHHTWVRNLDYLYLVFFVIHVPIMLVVDLVPYYPQSVRPEFTISLRKWYIATYRDRFFTQPPGWFHGYMALEVVYHIPLSLWAIGALLRNDALVPVHLLVFACETGITTLTCAIDMLGWDGYTRDEQVQLCSLYLPYLGLSILMGLDMFFRLKRTLETKTKTS